MATHHVTPSSTTTRAFRDQVTLRLHQKLTRALRALPTSACPPQQARAVINRYCRKMFVQPGVGGPGLVSFLCSPESASIPIGDIDDLIDRLARPGATPGGDYERATDAMAALVAAAQAH